MHLSTQILVAFCGLLICFSQVQAAEFLESLAKLYIPYDYDSSGNGLYGINKAAVEQSAYDEDARILYSAGGKYIHIIQLSTYLRILKRFPLPTGRAANDIEICGDYIAYVIEGQTSQANGTLIVRGKYNINTKEWPVTSQIQVGSKPDMLKFNHLCTVIMTANEGEAGGPDQNTFINPEGSISIVENFASSTPSVTTLDFRKFNNVADKLERWGVRAPYKGYLSGDSYNTFSQNMEPEYISISEDDRTAYVCLQENNAIAVVDIEQRTITDLIPLGTKSWGQIYIDGSDKDNKIFPENKKYDIFSFYQPDAIKVFSFNNTDYIFTANEGDRFEYELGSDDWDEGIRGKDLYDGDEGVELSDSMSSNLKDQLKDNDELGRLKFSRTDGLDDDGKVLRPHFFGARGVSIFRPYGVPSLKNIERVWDSADDVERRMKESYPDVFNGDTKPDEADNETPGDLHDSRSDNLGPECESIEFGEINGKTYAFFGIDRSAAILIYEIVMPTSTSDMELRFVDVKRDGGTSQTYQELLEERNLGDLDPEDLRFVPASKSPFDRPMLIVTSTVSGTIQVYEVNL
nr:mesenchyme-specific cell surface glycoprotein-like [Lytechinus pictus]